MKTMESNTNETVAILKRQIGRVLVLIQSLKKRASELEADNKVLASENRRLKSDIAQHSERVKSYEEKLKSLEDLLDEAQKDQNYLEQSILNAISNLGNIDGVDPEEHASGTSRDIDDVDTDDETSLSSSTHHESVSMHTEVDSESEKDTHETEEKEQVGIF